MSGESENKGISRALDWIKHTLDEIKTLLIAVGALITAAVPVYKYLVPDGGPPPPVPVSGSTRAPLAGCYRLKVIPPAHDFHQQSEIGEHQQVV